MAYSIQSVDVWSGSIEDRPGGLAEKLTPLTEAGATLEFVLARRAEPGKGIVFLAPLKGAKQMKAAQGAGLSRAADLQSLRVEGPDKPGLGAKVAKALAEAGLNVRGLSAMALGRRCVFCLAFDSKQDAAKARGVLGKIL